MNRISYLSIVVAVVIGILLIPSSACSRTPDEKVRIGTFDSRCVAIAYGRSASFIEYMHGLRAELKQAKEAGNDVRAKEIEQLGPTSQVLMHQQGFSTGTVGNIIEKIREKLPLIAEKVNVRLVVSQWEVAHHDASVELVDVTNELVALFAPDAQTLKIIEEIRKSKPVPIEQISLDPRE